MPSLPFIKFFPRDWMADEKLTLCSLAARGLWLEMLCLMHQNTRRRGYLESAAGRAVTDAQLARAVRVSEGELVELLAELEEAGVYSKDEAGVIYSRRMVKDEQFRAACSDAGKRGGGNPNLKPRKVPEKQGDEPTFKGQAKGGDKGSPKPQISDIRKENTEDPPKAPPQSRGATRGEPEPEAEPKPEPAAEPTPNAMACVQSPEIVPFPPSLDTDGFRRSWAMWRAKKRRKRLSDDATRRQLAKLAEIGPEAAVLCIEHSLSNDYQGLFPEKFANPRAAPGGPAMDHAGRKESRIYAQIAEGLAAP